MNRRVRPTGGMGGLPYHRDTPGPLHVPGAAGAGAPGLLRGVSRGPPRWLNKSTASNFPFRVGTTARQIVPANPLRVYLLVQNKDAGSDMFINFGQKADTFNGLVIIPRGNIELIGGAEGGAFCPMDSIWILGAAADLEGVLTEGVMPLG